MGKNIQKYDELKDKIESIFKLLQIGYDTLLLEDDDINYIIQVSTIGKLKALNSIDCILFLRKDDCSLNILVANIYKVKQTDNLLNIYELINDLNLTMPSGKFIVIGDDSRQIIYKSTVNCGDGFSKLDENLVRYQIILFIGYLEEFLDQLKKRQDKKE